jgi:molecular chaperone DnaK
VFGGSPDIEESPTRFKSLTVPAYKFLQEQIILRALVDKNMVFRVIAGSTMRPGEYRRVWDYSQLKCYYKLPEMQVKL